MGVGGNSYIGCFVWGFEEYADVWVFGAYGCGSGIARKNLGIM